jgi:hypothetical protein
MTIVLIIVDFMNDKQLFADNFGVSAKNILLNAIKHILLDPEILFVLWHEPIVMY